MIRLGVVNRFKYPPIRGRMCLNRVLSGCAGCEMHKEGEAVASAINGQDGKAWHLPLPPLTGTSLPEVFSPGEAPESDRARAAYRLVKNHAAVARFAARGAGQPGARPVWAPLSDPSAVPNEAVVEHVDAALQCVAAALLDGPEACADAVKTFKVLLLPLLSERHLY